MNDDKTAPSSGAERAWEADEIRRIETIHCCVSDDDTENVCSGDSPDCIERRIEEALRTGKRRAAKRAREALECDRMFLWEVRAAKFVPVELSRKADFYLRRLDAALEELK